MQGEPKPASTRVINFPSDKNGCGLLRSVVPFNYLSLKFEWDSTFMYQFVFDLNLIASSSWIRFQRQCTENQIKCIREYRKFIDKVRMSDKSKVTSKLCYELDDLVHGIEPHNILAYQFYTPSRRQNVVDIMRICNLVTFSTQFLKDFYDREFGIRHSVVIPNFLPKFLWNPDFTIDKRANKKKPVVFYAGSASHFGKGGDVEFLLPMIEATTDEFEWVFMGVCPPNLKGKVTFVPWVNFYDFAITIQKIKADVAIAPISDSIFNLGKSDLKFLEYSACNIPCICSTIGGGKGPYDIIKCQNLVENDVDSWYQSIKDMATNETRRKETLEMQQRVVNTRWLENDGNLEYYKKAFVN